MSQYPSLKLASQNVHLHLPAHKSVLLAGPHGSGKELLINIACNALGALLLDLSPANLAKSFNTGKSPPRHLLFLETRTQTGHLSSDMSRQVSLENSKKEKLKDLLRSRLDLQSYRARKSYSERK